MKSQNKQVLDVLYKHQDWLSPSEIARSTGLTKQQVSVAIHSANKHSFVESRGTLYNREHRITSRYSPKYVTTIYAHTPTADADEIVAAIFRKIQELMDENKDLKEENRQLRTLAGKHQSRPVPLPDYIAKALVKNGD